MNAIKVQVLEIVLARLKSEGNNFICHMLEDLAHGEKQLPDHSARAAAIELKLEIMEYIKPFHCYDTWYERRHYTFLNPLRSWDARIKFVEELIACHSSPSSPPPASS